MVDLFLLSISSSLDNFIVGVSLGIREIMLPNRLNLIVSSANAIGAFVSAWAGVFFGGLAPLAAGLGAAAIFLYLAYGEATGYWHQEPSPMSSFAVKGVAWRIALPMTLNNIAGGFAGGIAQLGPLSMGSTAFIASFALMHSGHKVGSLGARAMTDRLDPRCLAALAFFSLGMSQALNAWNEAKLCCDKIGPPKVTFAQPERKWPRRFRFVDIHTADSSRP